MHPDKTHITKALEKNERLNEALRELGEAANNLFLFANESCGLCPEYRGCAGCPIDGLCNSFLGQVRAIRDGITEAWNRNIKIKKALEEALKDE